MVDYCRTCRWLLKNGKATLLNAIRHCLSEVRLLGSEFVVKLLGCVLVDNVTIYFEALYTGSYAPAEACYHNHPPLPNDFIRIDNESPVWSRGPAG